MPGIVLSAFSFTFLFVLLFAIFANPNSFSVLSTVAEALLTGCFGVLAALLASIPASIVASLFCHTLCVKPEPDVFSILLTNWSMSPLGYGAALLVGFSIYPDEIYLMASFASAPLFGAIFGIGYSSIMIEKEKRTIESHSEQTFSLRSLFVVTAWLAVAIAIALTNRFAFLMAITCVPASLLGWAISTALRRYPKRGLAR